MKFNPYHNQVFIKQEDETEKIYGNIIVPDAGKEKPLLGKIIAVGPGVYDLMGNLIPMTARVGKKVAFPSFGGQKLMLKGEEFLIYKDTDLFGDIEDELSDIPSSLPKDMVRELLDIEETVIIPKREYDELRTKQSAELE